jgi:hypothetical protein
VVAFRLISALLLVIAAGCADRLPAPKDPLIAPDLRFAIPPPQALGYSIEVRQLIAARYRDELQSFEGLLSVAGDRLLLVALDGFGRRALTVEETGAGFTFTREKWVPASLDPANILADIAIIYWPVEAVRAGLAGTAAAVASAPDRRLITIGGREIIRVDYEAGEDHAWDGPVRYRNIAFGYELNLRSVVIRR